MVLPFVKMFCPTIHINIHIVVLVVNVDRCVVAVGVGGGTVPGHATGFLTPMNTTKEDCQ